MSLAAIQIQNILVPVDFSAHADLAVSWGADLARRLGARVLLVHVAEPVALYSDGSSVLMDEAANAAAREKARVDLDAVHRRLVADGTAAPAPIVVTGRPGDEVVRLAGKHAIDLIVMGTHGRTGLRRALLGSIAEHTLRHAPCPVLTVRTPAPAID